MRDRVKALYNFLRKPAQKFFHEADKHYHCVMWLIPVLVIEVALQSGTVPTLNEATAFAALMGYCFFVSIAARFFVRELNTPA